MNDIFLIFCFVTNIPTCSPDRPEALQGRARTHARHSSGSFDDICGVKRKDIEDTTQAASTIGDADPTAISLTNTTTSTAILEATTDDTAPTTTTTLDTNDTNATTEEDMGEKFGEGEGEGGWQGVMGRHSARKKKAHTKAAVQVISLLQLLFAILLLPNSWTLILYNLLFFLSQEYKKEKQA